MEFGPYDGLKVVLFDLTAPSFENRIIVEEIEFWFCRLSANCG